MLTRIDSPSRMNGGTCTTNPVSVVAGLLTFVTVAPLIAGSVSVTCKSTDAGKIEVEGDVIQELHLHDRVRNHVVHLLAELRPSELNLLVRVRVHEVVHVAIGIQVLHLAGLERHLRDKVLRGELLLDHRSRPVIPKLGLDESPLVARRSVLSLMHGADIAFVPNHHARTQLGRLYVQVRS